MTQEQLDAAKWQMFERHRKLVAERAVIVATAQSWGFALESPGAVLRTEGGSLVNLDLSGFPEKATMLAAQEELRSLNDQIKGLRESLRQAGMSML